MKERKPKEAPLTIDAPATYEMVLANEKSVSKYASRYKRMAASTLAMILRGKYPKSERRKSKFQVVLRQLKRSGYLVPSEF
jgi:hypothetical protein